MSAVPVSHPATIRVPAGPTRVLAPVAGFTLYSVVSVLPPAPSAAHSSSPTAWAPAGPAQTSCASSRLRAPTRANDPQRALARPLLVFTAIPFLLSRSAPRLEVRTETIRKSQNSIRPWVFALPCRCPRGRADGSPPLRLDPASPPWAGGPNPNIHQPDKSNPRVDPPQGRRGRELGDFVRMDQFGGCSCLSCLSRCLTGSVRGDLGPFGRCRRRPGRI